MVDPLDTPAVNAFYAQGPQLLGLVRGTFGFVGAPATYWNPTVVAGSLKWSLTGLGVGLVPIFQ
jgi:hypothetical protein